MRPKLSMLIRGVATTAAFASPFPEPEGAAPSVANDASVTATAAAVFARRGERKLKAIFDRRAAGPKSRRDAVLVLQSQAMRVLSIVAYALACTTIVAAQAPRAIPRPPAQVPNALPDGSAAPDGYAPIPAWLGQTRAPRPARSEAFAVETVATGLAGGFSFHFLPDGRIVVSERPGRIRIVGKDGTPSAPLAGMPAIWGRGPQGLFEVLPDRDFARNRVLYLTYTALPDGTDAAAPPRLAGVLLVARARLSDDSTR